MSSNKRVQVVMVSNEHWLSASQPTSSEIAGTQCSCGGQSGSGTCGQAIPRATDGSDGQSRG